MNPPPGTAPLQLALAAEPTAAFHIRARLRTWLHDHQWPADRRDDLVLVVNELVTNTIQHAYPPPRRRGSVDVTATVQPAGHDLRQVHIEVVDHGCWRLTAARNDRYGLPLVAALMDDLVISTTIAGTQMVTNSSPVPTTPVVTSISSANTARGA